LAGIPDDAFGGHRLSNATTRAELTSIQSAPVSIRGYVPIGSGTIILPGVE
jgi:acetyltransferase-like isoleucine patch superfamily enzyme